MWPTLTHKWARQLAKASPRVRLLHSMVLRADMFIMSAVYLFYHTRTLHSPFRRLNDFGLHFKRQQLMLTLQCKSFQVSAPFSQNGCCAKKSMCRCSWGLNVGQQKESKGKKKESKGKRKIGRQENAQNKTEPMTPKIREHFV